MLLSRSKVDWILGYFAAGTTKRTSSIIDMANYDGAMFTVGLGTILENGTLDAFVEQHTLNQTSGMARLATTAAYTVLAADALKTQCCIVIDVYRPQERYLQCNITPAVANAVVLGIHVVRYNGRTAPVTQGTTVLASTSLSNPAEA